MAGEAVANESLNERLESLQTALSDALAQLEAAEQRTQDAQTQYEHSCEHIKRLEATIAQNNADATRSNNNNNNNNNDSDDNDNTTTRTSNDGSNAGIVAAMAQEIDSLRASLLDASQEAARHATLRGELAAMAVDRDRLQALLDASAPSDERHRRLLALWRDYAYYFIAGLLTLLLLIVFKLTH
jgi:chromosome segregation ATPase